MAMFEEDLFLSECNRMVDMQIAGRGIRDERVLEAMRTTPRHSFVDIDYRHLAYSDGPLPIGLGQTISQPYIVALMTELAELKGNEVVLEVGTGSGYQAAILAHLALSVHTIERHAELAHRAQKILQQLQFTNITVHIGDGSLGLAEFSPYQAILVTAAAPSVPRTLLDQLDEGGRLIIPVGGRSGQLLERWRRKGSSFSQENEIPVAFVPLVGKQGWSN